MKHNLETDMAVSRAPCAGTGMCTVRSEADWVPSLYLFPLGLSQTVSLTGAPDSSIQASQKGPGVVLSLPSQCWDYPCGRLSPALLHGFCGETSGPMPMQQHFTK